MIKLLNKFSDSTHVGLFYGHLRLDKTLYVNKTTALTSFNWFNFGLYKHHQFIRRSSTKRVASMPETKKIYNFAAGPAKVPHEVLLKAQEELLNYSGCGCSVMELSHRSKTFQTVISEAEKDLRNLMSIPDNYEVLFMQGGGTGQFAAIPLNLCPEPGMTVDYMVTGTWSSKAAEEAAKYCKVNKVFPVTKKYTTIPDKANWKLSSDAAYVYYCANETIHGVEFDFVPDVGNKILVCDMSSNILTKPIDVSKHGIIFAGAQKNIGIAGVAIVIVRKDLLEKAMPTCPIVFSFKTTAANTSLYNTPPTFSIYILGLVLKWLKERGGADGMAKLCDKKSKIIYDIVEQSSGFYSSPVDPKYRSKVNIPFRIKGGDEELEKKFLTEAEKRGMIQLKGHRSVGGLRASLFNATSVEDTQFLGDFMKEFLTNNRN